MLLNRAFSHNQDAGFVPFLLDQDLKDLSETFRNFRVGRVLRNHWTARSLPKWVKLFNVSLVYPIHFHKPVQDNLC